MRANLTLAEAVADRMERKPRIMLLAREAFFLGSGDNPPIAHHGRGGIMIERTDAENVHQYCLRKCSTSLTGGRSCQ